MDDGLKEYLIEGLPEGESWIKDLQKQAEIDHVPIMDPVGMHFVTHLLKIKQPQKILEIGTAIGYSALRMAEVCPNAYIVSIEKDEDRYKQAISNIQKLNKQNQIKVMFGDALHILEQLKNEEESYDVIFIDAAKGKYKQFFDLSEQLLSSNGLIITDNVLFRGFVVNPESAPKRYKNMVHKIIHYNEYLLKHPDFTTTILPIGDGVAISSYHK